MLYLTTGIALATLFAMGAILFGPALAECYGKPGGAALCLQSKLSSLDIPPLPFEPPAPEPKVSDVTPAPAPPRGIDVTGFALAPVAETSVALAPNPGILSLSMAPATIPLTADSVLAPGQGGLVAEAPFNAPTPQGSADLTLPRGTLEAGPVPVAPSLLSASLAGQGRIAASGSGRSGGVGASDAAMLALSEGAIAIRLANYQPPAFGGALLAYLPPAPPPEMRGFLTTTGILSAPPLSGAADLVAVPPPVAEIIVDPAPPPVPPIAAPETLSPNVTVLPPPATGSDSAIVMLGGG